jgi:hypothetical protein
VGDGVGITKTKAESVTSISTWFKGNTDITRFNELGLFKNVTSISGAFTDCANLTNIDLSNIVSIGRGTFQRSGITSLNAPLVETIGNNAFEDCSQLVGDIVLPNLKSFGQVAFSGSSITSITAENVTTVAYYGFGDCANLERAIFPNATKLEVFAFRNCAKLRGVNLDKIENLGGAFSGCVLLKEFRLPSVVTIASQALDNASGSNGAYELFDLGENLQSVGNYALRGGPKMKAIVIRAVTPPTFGSGVFNSSNNCPIYVPDESVEAYKNATNMSDYASRIKPLSEYVE